ncbi:MAG: tetratricopeptide repeat protein [Planctomycetota bacterium]
MLYRLEHLGRRGLHGHGPAWPRRAGPVCSLLVLALTAGVLAATVGCGGDEVAPTEFRSISRSGDSSSPEQNDFEIAIDFVKMRDEHNLERSASQASYHFNRWLRDQRADRRWMIDRQMINTLPHAITRVANRGVLSDAALAKLEFDRRDVRQLEQTRWLRATAELLERTLPDSKARQRLRTMDLPPKAIRDLAVSYAAFDWTVRNIQLDELLDYPKSAAAGPSTGPNGADAEAHRPPPMRAVPGPGYTGTPWHVLLYGHGDAYQRARVFILLLRQLRIDAVMLGIDTKVGRARPWIPAVHVGGELYLFDPGLALPIPEPHGSGIATLSQVLEDPSVLSSLSIGTKYTYPVSQEDLDNVVAMIDASPRALSQRMALVQQRLGAKEQMVLTVSPSKLADPLRQCDGITDVRLWAVPIEAEMYDQAYSRLLAEDREAQRKEFQSHGLFQQLSPLVRGRRAYLLGQFNDMEDEEGAISHLRVARVSDDALEKMDSSRHVQRTMGLKQPRGMSDRDWQARLEQLRELQVQSKQHASYWIGLLHQQQGNYEIAINWLETRSLEKSPEGPWVEGARYNLARCHEALGHAEKAIKLYRVDDSPQRHGNLLRALRLEQPAAKAD